MQFKHILFGVLVAIIWGCNFIFVQMAMEEVPPLTLCAIRFFLSGIPLIFIVERPKVHFGWLASYSFLTFALQFAFLFLGMNAGVASGLASILSQIQVFLSFLFAALLLGERLTQWQVIGACFAFTGVLVVVEHLGGGDATLSGILWLLAAATAWGAGNTCIKKMGKAKGLGVVVWASFLAFPPLWIASSFVDGPSAVFTAFHTLSWRGAISVFYIVYISTWVGYGLWAWLLNIYSVNMIVPFTLLVPVAGMLASSFVLGEAMPAWKMTAACFILLGLMIHLLGKRLPRLLKPGFGEQKN